MKKISLQFSYTAQVLPPRCRIPRPTRVDATLSGQVREVTAVEAPVAIRAQLTEALTNTPMSIEYRWFDGKLWTSLRLSHAKPSGFTSRKADWHYEPLPESLDVRPENYLEAQRFLGIRCGLADDQASVKRKIRAALRDIIVVDGVWYHAAAEPRYVVMTFGLSGNHGGTSLSVDAWFNPNVKRSAYFSLLEAERARDYAASVAQARGDTKSLPISMPDIHFEVSVPEAIRVNRPRKAA